MMSNREKGDRKADRPLGTGRVLAAYLIVQFAILVGLVWKLRYFNFADRINHQIHLEDPFFPAFLRSAEIVRWCYLGSIAAIGLGVLGVLPWIRSLCGAVLMCCLSVLLVHQASYNDMTFTTSWWAALWSFWFTTRMGCDEPFELLRRGAFLSRIIGSMILLGGAVGKWTPEYWSGEVFYDLYFRSRDLWLFKYLSEHYQGETLRTIATGYSRMVVVVETMAGLLLWILPARAAAAVGVVLFFSIAFFSNKQLFSVMLCLVGLLSVGLLLTRRGRSAVAGLGSIH